MVEVVPLCQDSVAADVVLLPVVGVVELLPDDTLVGAVVGVSSYADFAAVAG